MEEISNKTLALMLLVAIAISLGGTMLSLNRLTSGGQGSSITGYATSSGQGYANVSITTTASLRFSRSILDFGSGSVNTSAGNQICNLASGQDSAGAKDGNGKCIGFNAANTFNSLEVENDGNMNFTLNLSANIDADAFIGGGPSNLEAVTFYVTSNETGSCPDPEPDTWSNINTTSMTICAAAAGPSGGFGYETSKNSVDIHINVTIPYDSLRTGSNQVITLTATGTSLV